MIDSLVLLAELYSCFYLIMAIMIAAGEYRFRKQKPPVDLPGVSVVVCARNEEHSIRRCMERLVRLDYPHDKMEILFVDDESEDSTRSILDEYAARYAFFKVLSTEGEPCDLPAKQRPLNIGIRESSGEIVLVTDADCAVKPGWIKGHIAAYQGEKIGIVAGITSISTDSGCLFSRLQNFDQISKLAIAMGCAGLGFPLTLMGNNMSFKRNAFTECGGFKKIGASIVEDVDLMYAILRNTNYNLAWVCELSGLVVSTPQKNFKTFLEQRLRMLNIMKRAPVISKILIGIEILMAYLFLFSFTVIIHSPYLFILICISWVAGYYLVMLPLRGFTKFNLIIFFLYLIFQFLYGNFIILKKFFGKKTIDWKGRRYLISD